MRVCKQETPVPSVMEISVGVAGTGVAFADTKMRNGLYAGTPPFPFVPGYDFAGTARDVGSKIAGLPGRAYRRGPFVGRRFRGHVAFDPCQVAQRPGGADPVAAAAAVLNHVTANRMLRWVGRVRAYRTAPVHGGAVWTSLPDLSGRLERCVIAIASVAEHDLVRLCVGIPIDYRRKDVVGAMAAKGRADAVFDRLGGRPSASVAHGGHAQGHGRGPWLRRCARGSGPGVRPCAGTSRLPRGCVSPRDRGHGSAASRTPFSHCRRISEALRAVLDLHGKGDIEPQVGPVLPLDRAARAHARLGAGTVSGRIGLRVGSPSEAHGCRRIAGSSRSGGGLSRCRRIAHVPRV